VSAVRLRFQCARGAMDLLREGNEVLAEANEAGDLALVGDVEAGAAGDFGGNATGLGAKLLTFGCELDADDAFVIGIAPAGDETTLFESFEEWCESAGIKSEANTELSYGDALLGPEDEQREVLRISHAERIEQRAIRTNQRPRRIVECEAELVVEEKSFFDVRHVL
jgi:hypothetical protein